MNENDKTYQELLEEIAQLKEKIKDLIIILFSLVHK